MAVPSLIGKLHVCVVKAGWATRSRVLLELKCWQCLFVQPCDMIYVRDASVNVLPVTGRPNNRPNPKTNKTDCTVPTVLHSPLAFSILSFCPLFFCLFVTCFVFYLLLSLFFSLVVPFSALALNTPTQGNLVIYPDKHLYILYFSNFVNGCKLLVWYRR